MPLVLVCASLLLAKPFARRPAANWPVGQNFAGAVGQISGVTPPVSPGKGRWPSSRTWVETRWTRQRRRARRSQGGLSSVSDRPAHRRTALKPAWYGALSGSRYRRSVWRSRAAYGKSVWFRHPLLMPSRRWLEAIQPDRFSLQAGGDGDKKEFVAEEITP